MSVDVMSAVWKARGLSHTEKLVLLRMADFASDDGTNIYPALDRLAGDTGCSRRTVQSTLRALEALGLITIHYKAGPHGTNRYDIDVANLARCSDCTVPSVDLATDGMERGNRCTQTVKNQNTPPDPPRGDEASAVIEAMIDRLLEMKGSWSGDPVRFRKRKRKELARHSANAERLLAKFDARPSQVAAYLLGEHHALAHCARRTEENTA